MRSAINGVCNYFLSDKINDEHNEHALGFDQNAAEKRQKALWKGRRKIRYQGES